MIRSNCHIEEKAGVMRRWGEGEEGENTDAFRRLCQVTGAAE
jgi:hypothetical protein